MTARAIGAGEWLFLKFLKLLLTGLRFLRSTELVGKGTGEDELGDSA